MNCTVREVLQFVEENDVKFVKLSFCDIFGNLRNISILATELEKAFTNGIPFDASVIKGFSDAVLSDLLLFPDPTTLFVLPWRPQFGRVVRLFCDLKHKDNTPYESDGRNILINTVSMLKKNGYTCNIGSKCEFYVFKTDDNGYPTKTPVDSAGCYDAAPTDRCENLRRDICLTLEEMNIFPTTSYHEKGAGQNEIDFMHSDLLNSADNLITFKSVVKTITSGNGMYATFMAKPVADTFGNGLHVNISIMKNNINIFDQDGMYHREGNSFIAGILHYIKEISVFANPTVDSYHRLGCFDAPKYISWTQNNYSQLIRVPCSKGDNARIELRSPDPSCNPYFLFTLIVMAGFKGIENGMELQEVSNTDLYTNIEVASKLDTLPVSLSQAVKIAKNSSFLKECLPQNTLDSYFDIKTEEALLYEKSTDKELFETVNYFNII